MAPDPTVGGSLSWAVWFLGEIAFKWVPGAVVGIVGTAPGAPSPAIAPIASPVTAPQIVDYLQAASAPGAYDSLFREWSTFVAFSLLFSFCFAALIIYCTVRVFQIRQMERRRFAASRNTIAAHDVPKSQLRWNRITEQATGESEQGWRLAILEADIMLNELLDSLGYKGETMADKMRGVERASFHTIDLAWEAHRIRNRVAHEGAAHILSERETRRVVALYERIFKEFHFVD
jgi:hypothetical protein